MLRAASPIRRPFARKFCLFSGETEVEARHDGIGGPRHVFPRGLGPKRRRRKVEARNFTYSSFQVYWEEALVRGSNMKPPKLGSDVVCSSYRTTEACALSREIPLANRHLSSYS